MAKAKNNKRIFWIKKKFDRRQLIRGTLNGVPIALGLPIFEQYMNDHGTAFADGNPFPIRFGTFFWGLGYGCDYGYYKSSKNADGTLKLSEALAPFADKKNFLTVFTDYSYFDPEGAGHIPQRGLGLSASHNPSWEKSSVDGYRAQTMPHPSIDTIVTHHWSKSTSQDYIAISAAPSGTLYRGSHSWYEGGGARDIKFGVNEVYEKLFSSVAVDTGQISKEDKLKLEANLKMKKSVLDGLKNQLKSLKGSLGLSDQLRLEAHLTEVENLEHTLSSMNNIDVSECLSTLQRPEHVSNNSQLRKTNEAMSMMIKYAFKCNLTRVLSYEFTQTQCKLSIDEIGLNGTKPGKDGKILRGIHDVYSHGDAANMRKYVRFIMDNFAHLGKELAEVKEGDKTLLDNTLLVGTSELGHSGGHNNLGHPYIFVGKAGSALKGNVNAVHPGSRDNNNDASQILLTAVRAVGIKQDRIGMPTTDSINGGDRKTKNYQTSKHIEEVFDPSYKIPT